MRIIALLILLLFQYQNMFSQEKEKNILNSESPKYKEEDYLTLIKKYSIDVLDYEEYEISIVTNIAADSNGNLYVVSIMDSKIFVFDSLGNFKKELGRPGQGPRELERPYSIALTDNKIYVYERNKGVKIWDAEGKYLDYFLFPFSKRLPNFYPYPDHYLVSYFEYEGNPAETGKWISHFYYSKFDLELNKISDINKIIIDEHKVASYHPTDIIAIDSENNIYTPVSPEIYRINKYNKDGDFLFSFGREYKSKKYSKKIRDWYYNKFTKMLRQLRPTEYATPVELKGNPPIVRHLMVDSRDNIWVVVGEWHGDNTRNYAIVSTVDIFSKRGDFLFTFETDKITPKSFIKNNLLYCSPRGLLFRNEGEDSNLNVYNIHYKKTPG
ncbi:6-bladed beta-propeller [candidate division KSB1 bacterium]